MKNIIFIEGGRFPKGKPDYVFYPKELIEFVQCQTKTVLSADEVDMILSDIDSFMLEPSFEIYKKHKEYVKSILYGN